MTSQLKKFLQPIMITIGGIALLILGKKGLEHIGYEPPLESPYNFQPDLINEGGECVGELSPACAPNKNRDGNVALSK